MDYSDIRKKAERAEMRGAVKEVKKDKDSGYVKDTERYKHDSAGYDAIGDFTRELVASDEIRKLKRYEQSAEVLVDIIDNLESSSLDPDQQYKIMRAADKRLKRTLIQAINHGEPKIALKYAGYGDKIKAMERKEKHSGLGKHLVIVMVGFLIGGLIFSSSILTGNAILGLKNSTSNFLGAILIILAIVIGFFLIKKKK